MKKEIKEAWLEALESGKYQQTTGALCHKGVHVDTFCCLGVLSDLYVQSHPDVTWTTFSQPFDTARGIPMVLNIDPTNRDTLPAQVMEWAELNGPDPSVDISQVLDLYPDENDEVGLAQINDSGRSFSQIAEIIRKNF